jgi:thiol-disulfide isomerase/thioredoxin
MFGKRHMPALIGATEWLNSSALSAADLRGRVILVHFGTLTCINWLRTVPHVRAWSRAYRDDGLVVVTVHTPEFSFEHDIDLVRRAIDDREIDSPVVVDNGFEIWNAFDNHYWPALYFVDRDGIIRDHHFGEGRYDESERVLQSLLGLSRDPVPVVGTGVEAEAEWSQLRSPETYLGADRSRNFASPPSISSEGGGRVYEVPQRLPLNHWALGGHWSIQRERVVLSSGRGRLACRFHARDVHLVMSSDTEDPIGFRVLVDGQPPEDCDGLDVDPHGDGALLGGRMYQLVRQRAEVRQRTLEITFDRPGVHVYAFTFG